LSRQQADGAPRRAVFAYVDVYEDKSVLGGNDPLLRVANALCTPRSARLEKDT